MCFCALFLQLGNRDEVGILEAACLHLLHCGQRLQASSHSKRGGQGLTVSQTSAASASRSGVQLGMENDLRVFVYALDGRRVFDPLGIDGEYVSLCCEADVFTLMDEVCGAHVCVHPVCSSFSMHDQPSRCLLVCMCVSLSLSVCVCVSVHVRLCVCVSVCPQIRGARSNAVSREGCSQFLYILSFKPETHGGCFRGTVHFVMCDFVQVGVV